MIHRLHSQDIPNPTVPKGSFECGAEVLNIMTTIGRMDPGSNPVSATPQCCDWVSVSSSLKWAQASVLPLPSPLHRLLGGRVTRCLANCKRLSQRYPRGISSTCLTSSRAPTGLGEQASGWALPTALILASLGHRLSPLTRAATLSCLPACDKSNVSFKREVVAWWAQSVNVPALSL